MANLEEEAKKYRGLVDAVKTKLRKLYAKRLGARRKALLSKHAANCVNKVKNSPCCSILSGTCDDERANACEFFHCRTNRESVDQSFFEIISNADACSRTYPNIAILHWLLLAANENGVVDAAKNDVKVAKHSKAVEVKEDTSKKRKKRKKKKDAEKAE